ncbi:MAG: bifunctional oligoribonuclease/PAP phosphatase NrnA [bacterium]|nr:MAG: bifunctional oligoribonuclease/PAP phosphatase NrnA [bacterium]
MKTTNYNESQLILEEIKRVKRILLNCHRSPDPDSIGSALAMKGVLLAMGKEVEVICPSDELYQNVSYLSGFDTIKKGVNFNEFDFSSFELFITLDSSNWDMVTGLKNFIPKDIRTIVIDHHHTNNKYGEINLIDQKVTSVGELLYLVFEDWNIVLNKEIADSLMAGIVGDTGAFRYPGANERTFNTVSTLMKLGGDKDKAIHNLYRSDSFELIKFYGEALSSVQIDKEHKFVWTALPHQVYQKYNKLTMAKESVASMFCQVVEGTEFGFVALEQEKDVLAISFRSRTGFDTSAIATELGGGGHIYASGAKVEAPFNEALEKVLTVCRKYANKS